jgi:Protein of unknown function (DUF2911)
VSHSLSSVRAVRVVIAGATIALSAGAPTAGAQGAEAAKAPPVRVAASSFSSTEVHFNARPIGGEWYAEDAGLGGPARIAITWGQPHARGRKIEGGLVPIDTVWRFGANMATALHTDLDLTLGTLAIPRGDYTLFVLYTRAGWQLIVNKGTAQWGTDYDAAKDLGRVSLARRGRAEPEGSLSIYLVPDAAKPASGYAELSGVLRIVWGTTELTAPWKVAP